MKRYPSDLSEREWELLRPLLTRSDARGAGLVYDKRELINAIFYLLDNGCKWRSLPKCFPPWSSVYDHFRRWNQRGIWKKALEVLQRRHRQAQGRAPTASLAIIDAQSVKTVYRGEARGFDGGKKNQRPQKKRDRRRARPSAGRARDQRPDA